MLKSAAILFGISFELQICFYIFMLFSCILMFLNLVNLDCPNVKNHRCSDFKNVFRLRSVPLPIPKHIQTMPWYQITQIPFFLNQLHFSPKLKSPHYSFSDAFMLAGWPPRSVTVSQEIVVVTRKLLHARHLAWTWIWLVVLSLGEAGTQL